MNALQPIPGLYYTAVPPAAQPSPLRTDVAGFFGRTRRGPPGIAVRVTGWREYDVVFGGLSLGDMTPYALKGYFDNEAQVAYVVRLLGAGAQVAAGTWQAGGFDAASASFDPDWPGASGLQAIQFQVDATSPGDWANKTVLDIRYWAVGRSGKPEIELTISPPGEVREVLGGIAPSDIVAEVNARSAYVRLTPAPLPAGLALLPVSPAGLALLPVSPAGLALLPVSPAGLALLPVPPAGPRYFEWPRVTLAGGTTVAPTKEDHLAAVTVLGDQTEVALMACPDLYHPDFYHPDLPDASNQIDTITTMLAQAARLNDRLVLIDVPPAQADAVAAVAWIDTTLRQQSPEPILRNGAVYHPRLLVPDPLGIDAQALLCVPPSGCVAGAIARQDLRLGAYFTPANTPIEQALDLSPRLDANGQAALYGRGINLLTCSPGHGLLVWGGRVLGKQSPGGFVAHRRLIHLLVRAIRRVAEPLVFDTNGPELWLALVRNITTILLAAWRAGALKGDQAGQAFQVICDASTNPPDQIDEGMVVCMVKVAPAVPMEFITLRVAASADGQLEVFQS